MSRRTRKGPKRSYKLPIAVVLVLILGVITYYIFTSSGIAASSALDGTAASSTVLNDLNNVSTSTLTSVGAGPAGITAPSSTISGTTTPSPITSNGKPEVLYIGAEYCPYCGAERWALIVALDKFGTFSGIDFMQSAASPEVYPDTSTFDFQHATYTSSYITFVTYEQEDRSEAPLEPAPANDTALMTKYDSGSSIPFILFANQYYEVGAQYVPQELRVDQSATGNPYNWTQIASQLNTPSSVFAMYIDGAANKLISTICKIDGGDPVSLCSQSFASTLSYTVSPHSAGSQLLTNEATLTVPTAPPAATAMFAPSRPPSWD